MLSIPCAVLILAVFSKSHGSGLAQAQVSPEVLDSYRSYSLALLHDKFTRRVGDDFGAYGYSTLGLGHLLAVINEQFWPVDNYGFDNALKVPKTKIFSHYKTLFESLAEDPAVTMYSDIYSSSPDAPVLPPLTKITTETTFVDYNTSTANVNSVVAQINARIAVQTFGKIYGSLVPEGGWWGLPFFNYTQSILTNTFHFQADFANSLSKTTESQFDDGQNITFLETKAVPMKSQSDNYKAVRVPLKNSDKSLVLILPNANVTQFIKQDLEAHLRKAQKDLKVDQTVKIRIPKLNLTIPTSYFRQLKKFGVTESMCRYEKDKENTFESPVQNVHISLDENLHLVIATATGSHVNNVRSYIDINESQKKEAAQKVVKEKPKPVPAEEPQQDEQEGDEANSEENNMEENMEMFARMRSDFFSEKELKPTTRRLTNRPSLRDSAETSSENRDHAAIKRSKIIFDREFFFYLDDPNLGPIFFGSVESFEKYRKHENDVPPKGSEWQTEALKYLFWSCP